MVTAVGAAEMKDTGLRAKQAPQAAHTEINPRLDVKAVLFFEGMFSGFMIISVCEVLNY